MSLRLKDRSGKPAQSVESLLESLKEYTFRVAELTRVVESQRTSTVLVGYVLISIAFLISLVAVFILEKTDFKDQIVSVLLSVFVLISVCGIPILVYRAILRSRQHRTDLRRAMSRLMTTMSFASQIKDHIEFERLDDLLINMHLLEADEALSYARRIVGHSSIDQHNIGKI
jgi:glucan phosphoethanolaminetransferase (alkaline phosphatase superfamily)